MSGQQESSAKSLSADLCHFGAPLPPADVEVIALMAETREQLAALSVVATWARAECPQSAPLVEALRGHIEAELTSLTDIRIPDLSMQPRLQELHTSAKEGLRALRN